MKFNGSGITNGGKSSGRKSPEEGKKVKFVVGNRIFRCPKSTINKYPESHLAKLIASSKLVDLWEIDRRPEDQFELVMKLMEFAVGQDKKHQAGMQIKLGELELEALHGELDHYNLASLKNLIRLQS